MAQEAIRQDASEVVATEGENLDEVQPTKVVEETPVLERDNLMSDLVNRRKQKHAEENGADVDQEEEVVSPPASESTPQDTAAAVVSDEEKLVELKVDGEQMFRTTKEVKDAGGVPAIQKQLSGERKLELAAKRQRELDLKEANLDERERSLGEKTSQPAKVETETVPKVDAKALAEQLVLGDTEKVAGAIDTLLTVATQPAQTAESQSVQQPVDLNALKEDVKADLKQEQMVNEAVEDFKKDFKDIYDHPGSRMIANQETIRLQKEYPDWKPSQIMTEAGKRARAVVSSSVTPVPENSSPESTPLEQKRQEKKESVDQIPQAHTRGPTPVKDEHKPKTKAEIFKEMEASRSH